MVGIGETNCHLIFSQPDQRHASEDNQRLVIKFNDGVDCESGGICILSLGYICSFVFDFSHA